MVEGRVLANQAGLGSEVDAETVAGTGQHSQRQDGTECTLQYIDAGLSGVGLQYLLGQVSLIHI